MNKNPRSVPLAGDFFVAHLSCDTAQRLANELRVANQTMIDAVERDLGASPVLAAVQHHLNAGGNRLRLAMGLAAGQALNIAPPKRQALAIACELVHNASLIHDDLQDQDPTRRNQPAVWAKFGSDMAICAGDYLLSSAYRHVAIGHHRVADIVEHLHHRISELIDGQGLDLAWSNSQSVQDPMAHYQTVAKRKSGPLLGLPMELGLLAADQDTALASARAAGDAFAIAYQISDDLKDLKNDIRHQSLNLVHMLMVQGHNAPVDAAITEGALQLERCIQYATTLPNGVGEFLVQCAQHMMGAFEHTGEQADP